MWSWGTRVHLHFVDEDIGLESHSRLVAKLGLNFGLLALRVHPEKGTKGPNFLYFAHPEKGAKGPKTEKLEDSHIVRGLSLPLTVNKTPLKTEGP